MSFHLILQTNDKEITSPPICPLHPMMKEDDGRILMLIKKIGQQITETDDEVIGWRAKWEN